VWFRPQQTLDLVGLAPWPPAAGGGGSLQRIPAAGARSGTEGPDRRVAEETGGGGDGQVFLKKGDEVTASAEQRRERLVELYKQVSTCTKCPLHETRAKTVFGAGNADAELMFVGEAPGAEEDRQGLPFVGRAGQLLNQLLEEIGLSREDVFIANVLKSRPPGNRDPLPLEIAACEPYLFEQVRLIEPKVVCTLGNFATKLLSGSPVGITKVRGTPQVHELGGRTVFLLPLLHPAAALRTPAMKETLRGDFATIPGLLAGPSPTPTPSAEEIAAEEPAAGEQISPQPPSDQLDMFG
jgi:uracil-DNA glycosylase